MQPKELITIPATPAHPHVLPIPPILRAVEHRYAARARARAQERRRQLVRRITERRRAYARSFTTLVASWYVDDFPGAQTASGFTATYGVASRTLAFGTRLTIRYAGRMIQATVDDRGPYVAGRDLDLNENVAAALGFTGVQSIAVSFMRPPEGAR